MKLEDFDSWWMRNRGQITRSTIALGLALGTLMFAGVALIVGASLINAEFEGEADFGALPSILLGITIVIGWPLRLITYVGVTSQWAWLAAIMIWWLTYRFALNAAWSWWCRHRDARSRTTP